MRPEAIYDWLRVEQGMGAMADLLFSVLLRPEDPELTFKYRALERRPRKCRTGLTPSTIGKGTEEMEELVICAFHRAARC